MAYGVAEQRIKERLMAAGADCVAIERDGLQVGVGVTCGDRRHAVRAHDLSEEDAIVTKLTDWMNGLQRS